MFVELKVNITNKVKMIEGKYDIRKLRGGIWIQRRHESDPSDWPPEMQNFIKWLAFFFVIIFFGRAIDKLHYNHLQDCPKDLSYGVAERFIVNAYHYEYSVIGNLIVDGTYKLFTIDFTMFNNLNKFISLVLFIAFSLIIYRLLLKFQLIFPSFRRLFMMLTLFGTLIIYFVIAFFEFLFA